MTRPQQVSPAEAETWLDEADTPTVLDVRTPAEFAGTRIRGAVNAPLDLIEDHTHRIGQAIPGDVLLVCRTDNRASQAARLLAPVVGDRVHVLTGGMTAWEADHQDVERGEGGPWAMDRQVRTVAGALALTGVLASLAVPRAKWLAGGIGAGLLYSGISDTCGMSKVLDRMPWNQSSNAPTTDSVVRQLAARSRAA